MTSTGVGLFGTQRRTLVELLPEPTTGMGPLRSGLHGQGFAPKSEPTGLSKGAAALAALGALTEAAGSFFEVRSDQRVMRAEAADLAFQADAARQNAEASLRDATAVARAGQQESGRLTLAAGQRRGSARASDAGRGIRLSSRSLVERRAGERLVTEIDRRTLRADTLRAANARRIRAADLRGQAAVLDASSRARRVSAKSLSPALAGVTTLLERSGSFL